jgi:hypothetical protein
MAGKELQHAKIVLCLQSNKSLGGEIKQSNWLDNLETNVL